MIKIITKDHCPFCLLAKELISSLWFEYEEIDVSNDQEKLIEIVNISQMRTVPQIYVWEITKENLLWWYSDVKALNDEWILIDRLKNI